MYAQEMEATALAMVGKGKGILAADESNSSCERRFKSVGVESTVENRRAYRELLFTTPGLEEFISGVILFDETIRQATAGGVPFVDELKRRGMIPGIKVDTGAKDLALCPGEKVTEGLDGLRERLVGYKKLDARFAKWRAVITIGANIPSATCIRANAHALARYAALCQEAGLVPMIEPEVLIDGDHTIERCFEVTEATLKEVFNALYDQRVVLEHTILKTSMVLSGAQCPRQAGVEEVARQTIRCLKRSAPAALPGIVFLSGGQSEEVATAHLNAMNALKESLPWPLTFSFSRALQQPALKAWRGNAANVAAAQRLLYHRARMNSLASLGIYSEAEEKKAA
jgi:fructose-bisphosphate aldolase, class I